MSLSGGTIPRRRKFSEERIGPPSSPPDTSLSRERKLPKPRSPQAPGLLLMLPNIVDRVALLP